MGEKMKVLDMILIGKLQKYLNHRFAMLIIRNTLYGLIFYLLKKQNHSTIFFTYFSLKKALEKQLKTLKDQ